MATVFSRPGDPGIVVVYFHAPWCAPCREQRSVLDVVAGRFSGRAAIRTIEIDHHQELAQRMRIQSIPTLLIFENGREVERCVGLQSDERLTRTIARRLRGSLSARHRSERPVTADPKE